MTYICRAALVLMFGASAVKVLHFDARPSYLVLFFGWAALALFFVEGGNLIADMTKSEARQ
jgi:hypothetical protein